MARALSLVSHRPVRWRLPLIGLLAAALVAGTLTAPASPAYAEEPRPPRSGTPGITAPEIASDIIPTNLVIAPRPGESFRPFTIEAVQLVPMTKVLRNGQIDPDHAIAYWDFTIRFPRSNAAWPPHIPEPTDPWRFHLYEMPDGGITGIGPSHMGSPLYGPGPDLPPDWLERLVPAARAGIPEGVLNAALMGNVMESGVARAGFPGGLVPPWPGDGGAWAGLVVAGFLGAIASVATGAAIVAGVVSGPCGGFVVSVLFNEYGAWAELAMISTSSPTARVVRASTAVTKKLTATASLLLALDSCTIQAAAATTTPGLSALYIALAGFATAVWTVSTLTYFGVSIYELIQVWS